MEAPFPSTVRIRRPGLFAVASFLQYRPCLCPSLGGDSIGRTSTVRMRDERVAAATAAFAAEFSGEAALWSLMTSTCSSHSDLRSASGSDELTSLSRRSAWGPPGGTKHGFSLHRGKELSEVKQQCLEQGIQRNRVNISINTTGKHQATQVDTTASRIHH